MIRERLSRGPIVTLLGLLLGLGIALGLGVGLFYVVPRQMGRSLVVHTLQGERISLHLPPDSPLRESAPRVLEELESTLGSLVQATGTDGGRLPPVLNVFLHRDLRELVERVRVRESPESRIWADPVDLVWGEDPRGVWIQVVGDYGWGEGRSRLLRHGLVSYLVSSDPPHLAAAALPPSVRFSLPELLVLEARGRFPRTRYEALNSPHSRLGLGGLGEVRPLDRDLEALSRSFVAFLIEEMGGLPRLMGLWRPGRLSVNLEQVYGLPLDELGRRWAELLEQLEQKGDPILRAQALLRIGALESALELLGPVPSPQAAGIRAWVYFLLGKRAQAQEQLAEAEAPGELAAWLEATRDWSSARTDSVVAHVAPDFRTSPELVGYEAAALLGSMQSRLGIPLELPEITVLFCGPQIVPPDPRAGLIAVPDPESLGRVIAEYLTVHLWKDSSWSQLLLRGLIRYLAEPDDAHTARLLHEVQRRGGIPLRLLDFGSWPEEVVEPLAAGLVGYLLEHHDPALFKKIWILTSPLGGRSSLDGALKQVYGFTRAELEEAWRSSTLPDRE
jgi:hypothetical protein